MEFITKRIDKSELVAFLHQVEPEYMAMSEDDRLLLRMEHPEVPATKLYLGCDSEKFKLKGTWYADYARVIVVHVGGNKGCRIFGEVIRIQDYDVRKDKPRLRLMTEAYKATELYLEFADVIEQFETQIHLDVNPNLMHNSSIVVNEAIGYVKAMTNVVPMVKDKAWAASYASDRFKEIMSFPKAQALSA